MVRKNLVDVTSRLPSAPIARASPLRSTAPSPPFQYLSRQRYFFSTKAGLEPKTHRI